MKEKLIGNNVVVSSEPGLLRVTITQRLSFFWKTAVAVLLALSIVAFLMLKASPSSPDSLRETRKTDLGYMLMVIAAVSALRLILPDNEETISISQGTLTIRTRITVFRFREEFSTAGATRFGLNIPEGMNYARRKAALTQKFEKRFSQRYQPYHGAISFFYADELVELAHQVDRLTATYILKELENFSGK